MNCFFSVKVKLGKDAFNFNSSSMRNYLEEHFKLTLLPSLIEFVEFVNNLEYSHVGRCFHYNCLLLCICISNFF